LFLGRSQAYAEEAGTGKYCRVNTIGNIRGHHITPKDTEIRQVNASESAKAFKRYFLANQFQLSHMQGDQGVEDVVSQVLDEHQIQMDELFLLGEGTSSSNMLNNSLFWSNDPNYVLEASYEVKKDASNNYLLDLHSKVVANATKANRISGRKLILFYGTSIVPLYNSLFINAVRPFKSSLTEVLGANYSVAELPTDITPAGANGWIIANLDKVKLNYTTLPALKAQGSNDEKMYYWFNFLMGSCMLEVLSSGGIVRQPATLQA